MLFPEFGSVRRKASFFSANNQALSSPSSVLRSGRRRNLTSDQASASCRLPIRSSKTEEDSPTAQSGFLPPFPRVTGPMKWWSKLRGSSQFNLGIHTGRLTSIRRPPRERRIGAFLSMICVNGAPSCGQGRVDGKPFPRRADKRLFTSFKEALLPFSLRRPRFARSQNKFDFSLSRLASPYPQEDFSFSPFSSLRIPPALKAGDLSRVVVPPNPFLWWRRYFQSFGYSLFAGFRGKPLPRMPPFSPFMRQLFRHGILELILQWAQSGLLALVGRPLFCIPEYGTESTFPPIRFFFFLEEYLPPFMLRLCFRSPPRPPFFRRRLPLP